MALTPSIMAPLGSIAPDFKLPDGQGRHVSLSEAARENGLLVVFMCNHCPFVKHIAGFLEPLHQKLADMNIGMVAINANDITDYPEDAPDKMVAISEEHGFTFPYLYDESQTTARSYDAACTPDFFLYDQDLKLFYRGQLDNSRPGNGNPITGKDLLEAAEAIVGKTAYSGTQNPSVGCNIKWKE
ncbi:thioredoxin family protein [Gynuella sp.]|uniref:thioredoxin family protein n=1 Tax=Gynuella sp. TaxID=2969146 RepID=UPI003D099888